MRELNNRPLCRACLLCILLICIAVCAGKDKVIKELRPSPMELHVQEGERIALTGRVCQKQARENYEILYLKDNSITCQERSFKESKIIVYNEKKEKIHIGQTVRITGKAFFFEPAHNPGNFDQRLYHRKQGIHGAVWAEDVRIVHREARPFADGLYELRAAWKAVFLRYMPKEDGAALSAMILGEKAEMDKDLKELYQANGIGHVLAISGLHMSLLGTGLYQLLRKSTGSYKLGGAAGIVFLLFYVLLIGFTVSVVRALVMFLFQVGADMTGRHYDAPTAFSVAAVVVLLWRPLSLYDGGFWLSFGAVFAILAVAPVLSKAHALTMQRSGERIWKHMRQGILQGLTASISIHLAILPVLLYYFFEIPIYSFILNLFVIPLMSVLLFLGMVGSLSVLWCERVSSLLFLACSVILRIYQISCKITLHLPGARLVIGKPAVWQIVIYYGILFLGFVLLRHILAEKERKEQGNAGARISGRTEKGGRRQWLVIFLWAVGIIILTARFGETGKLTAVVLDVGQGDGIFLKGPKGGTYLVDGGSSDIKKVGQYRLESFLKSQGAGTLDYVLLSHGDSDHMNGVEELIERQDIGVKIGTLVLPVQEAWDEALAGIAEKARAHGVRVAVMGAGQSIREGDMAIICIQPGDMGMETGKPMEAGNAASMVLAVQYGKFDMLLTGDVEGEGEEQLTKQLGERYRDCTWEVLKVAHHGSKNSSTEGFLRRVQPAYALVSAGKENRYGHPHQETLERLGDVGSKIYSTQENGAIMVEVEGGGTLRIGRY